ncbi:D-TA family PLP-dependent enzyme [Persicitalea jodogahamensis]|uniref:Threonine aldolase n=1 Tax=Persicitalea jodogahamensis TaxID=402147 RepID=A0A8J3D9E7_9BACT|nr:D-TA family PLP-dependent enzyme [Persicitalea jodogahamensis]GHB79379.1 threonine aldolase [Persicitalea jodogahamensis]
MNVTAPAAWYEIQNPEKVFTPGLLIYKDRVAANIDAMIDIVGDPKRLVPHVKTHKMGEVIRMQLNVGIDKFKCATIAEAELLADTGANWVLIAYQLVGPNVARLLSLKAKYPDIHFASLVDSLESARMLNAQAQGEVFHVFIDVNNGMNRSGYPVSENLLNLYKNISELPQLDLQGLHVYDGHIRDEDFAERKRHSDADFAPVEALRKQITSAGLKEPMIIAGGTPTFNVHALRGDVYCSPGTCPLWDWGYGDRFLDQPFQHAALVATRVISKPTSGIITVDLGHKAVAAENPIDRRFRFLNLEGYEVVSQSEEHGVIKVSNWEAVRIGDLLYAIPYHVCPTVALHETAAVITNGTAIEEWEVRARKRRITI